MRLQSVSWLQHETQKRSEVFLPSVDCVSSSSSSSQTTFDLSEAHLSGVSCPQVCGDRHGGSGPAADGLSLSEHQTLRGEFPAHGGQAAGVQRTGPAGPGDQLGKIVRTNFSVM